ncbi:MAG: hypothetical protein JXA38_05135 [Methanosarcinaceae archaeon]|nr:hypothetical protein [Methanosarcinaceae archaeon]
MVGITFSKTKEDFYTEQITEFCETVTKVKVVKGHISTDPTFWIISFGEFEVKLDSRELENQNSFRRAYLKTFDLPAPGFKGNNWLEFVQFLATHPKRETVQSVDESAAVYAANQLIEFVRDIPQTDDPEDAAAGQAMLKKDGHYCVSSSKIKDILDAHRFSVSPELLSPAMTELGYKKGGTAAVRCGGKLCRFWWFTENIFSGCGQND